MDGFGMADSMWVKGIEREQLSMISNIAAISTIDGLIASAQLWIFMLPIEHSAPEWTQKTMTTVIEVVDQTATGRELRRSSLSLSSRRVTVSELITARVRDEVAKWNSNNDEFFAGLVQPTGTETVLNGNKLARSRPVDVDEQVLRAKHAFETNGFFVLVGDRQVRSLEEEIELTPRTSVAFVKLVPLIGG